MFLRACCRKPGICSLRSLGTKKNIIQAKCKQSLNVVPNIRFSPSEISLVNILIKEAGLISFFGGDPSVLPDGIVSREIVDFKQTWDLNLIAPKAQILSPIAKELVTAIKQSLK